MPKKRLSAVPSTPRSAGREYLLFGLRQSGTSDALRCAAVTAIGKNLGSLRGYRFAGLFGIAFRHRITTLSIYDGVIIPLIGEIVNI